MSAKKGKGVNLAEIEAVDLISLLTPPGSEGAFEAEIVYAGEEIYDPPLAASPTTGEQCDLESLQNLMGKSGSGSEITTNPRTDANPGSLLQPLELIENDSLTRISEEISVCEKCELCKTRNKTVPGTGPEHARLVFIGEAPGADEDKIGLPFVGRAGQHLDKILKAAGFSREEVFICNILKCRPPGNRNPTLSEMVCCTPFLQRQLNLIKPKLIACLGNVATRYVIGPKTPGITKIHGQWFESIFKIPAMAMYHPSYLVRSESRERGSPNWQMWQDIQKLKKRYDELNFA
ncbi:MAG: hypothetical protein Kow0029_07950 [Candidatus Rifleibacteriota bacterium]